MPEAFGGAAVGDENELVVAERRVPGAKASVFLLLFVGLKPHANPEEQKQFS